MKIISLSVNPLVKPVQTSLQLDEDRRTSEVEKSAAACFSFITTDMNYLFNIFFNIFHMSIAAVTRENNNNGAYRYLSTTVHITYGTVLSIPLHCITHPTYRVVSLLRFDQLLILKNSHK